MPRTRKEYEWSLEFDTKKLNVKILEKIRYTVSDNDNGGHKHMTKTNLLKISRRSSKDIVLKIPLPDGITRKGAPRDFWRFPWNLQI